MTILARSRFSVGAAGLLLVNGDGGGVSIKAERSTTAAPATVPDLEATRSGVGDGSMLGGGGVGRSGDSSGVGSGEGEGDGVGVGVEVEMGEGEGDGDGHIFVNSIVTGSTDSLPWLPELV